MLINGHFGELQTDPTTGLAGPQYFRADELTKSNIEVNNNPEIPEMTLAPKQFVRAYPGQTGVPKGKPGCRAIIRLVRASGNI